ncbi:MAG TPA: hypothetical protein VHE30_14970, partial [Polyangiaceae bacterium]|nr:hypothetical protein [Polyangiaceae bacterium]
MNVRILIDGVVRQTTVLIAQLATAGGLRAPLAHVAGQVFLDLSKELEAQGLTKKVTADMFGMALRTYQRRTQRLAQSVTDRGRSLWEALLDYVQKEGVVTREQIFKRFRHDDEASLRGVLRDLTESGVLFASGVGASAVYRVASSEELGKLRGTEDALTAESLVWSLVFRNGPLPLEKLATLSGLSAEALEPILAALATDHRVLSYPSEGSTWYRSAELVLGLEDPVGWEAAVLDHFTVVVRTIVSKLARETRARLSDESGGST